MQKKWKVAGAVLALAVAIPATAYAADSLSSKGPGKEGAADKTAIEQKAAIAQKGTLPAKGKELDPGISELAVKLGLDKAAYEQAIKDGKSLADIAEEKGIAVQPLIDQQAEQIIAQIEQKMNPQTDEEKSNIRKKATLEAERIMKTPLSQQHQKKPVLDYNLKAAFDLLGLDKASFIEQSESGKSLADIAADRGISRQQLIEALSSDLDTQADKLVQSQMMTQEQADQVKQELLQNMDRFVNEVARKVGEPPKGKELEQQKKPGLNYNIKAAFDLLGLDKASFIQQMESGKSLADIAADRGLSRQHLIDALSSDLDAQAAKLVQSQTLTQEQVDKEKQDLLQSIDKFIESKNELVQKK